MAFFETGAFVGLIAPGETVMLVGGLIAGQGRVDVFVLIGIAWASAVAGDVTSLYLGRRLGRRFLVKHGPKVSITEERLHAVEGFFDRHGGKAILIGRFVGLVRAIAPFLAGSSGMEPAAVPALRRHRRGPVDLDVHPARATSSGSSFGTLLNYAKTGALALGTSITVVVGVVVAYRWLREEEHRRLLMARIDARARPAAAAPAGLRAAPGRPAAARARALFAWNRLTPGELGIELTTLLAIAAVGSFAFVANAVTLSTEDYAALDLRTLTMARDLAQGTALSRREGRHGARVAAGGRSSSCWPPPGSCSGAASAGRAAALVVGLVLIYVVVHVDEGRLRPPAADRPGHAGTRGAAFPSGHAAYATAWVACAIALARALPTLGTRFSIVVTATIVAAVDRHDARSTCASTGSPTSWRAGAWGRRSSRPAGSWRSSSASCATIPTRTRRPGRRRASASRHEQHADHLRRRRGQRAC